MTGKVIGKTDSFLLDRKAEFEYPWWVSSYPSLLYTSFLAVSLPTIAIFWSSFEAEDSNDALKYIIAATTYGYVLDQCTFLYCHFCGRTPFIRPLLELVIIAID